MPKNILVLTGSARKNGNSELLADAFIKGALAKGHVVNKFETAMKKIDGCKGCDLCWSKGQACIYRDDFDQLVPLLEAADVVVYASPLYWCGISSQLKGAIDRMYACFLEQSPRPLKVNSSILLACGGEDDITMFNGMVETFKGMCNYLEWNIVGIMTISSVDKSGDIKNTTAFAKAEELGKSL